MTGSPTTKSDYIGFNATDIISYFNKTQKGTAARRFFNGNVREQNQLCGMFPTSLIAGVFGFGPETFFELSSEAERVTPRVRI